MQNLLVSIGFPFTATCVCLVSPQILASVGCHYPVSSPLSPFPFRSFPKTRKLENINSTRVINEENRELLTHFSRFINLAFPLPALAPAPAPAWGPRRRTESV